MSVIAISDVDIVHRLNEHKEFSLSPGDTIVAKVDFNELDIEEIQAAYNMLEKAFPRNNILILNKNIELEVYRHAN